MHLADVLLDERAHGLAVLRRHPRDLLGVELQPVLADEQLGRRPRDGPHERGDALEAVGVDVAHARGVVVALRLGIRLAGRGPGRGRRGRGAHRRRPRRGRGGGGGASREGGGRGSQTGEVVRAGAVQGPRQRAGGGGPPARGRLRAGTGRAGIARGRGFDPSAARSVTPAARHPAPLPHRPHAPVFARCGGLPPPVARLAARDWRPATGGPRLAARDWRPATGGAAGGDRTPPHPAGLPPRETVGAGLAGDEGAGPRPSGPAYSAAGRPARAGRPASGRLGTGR